MFQPAEDDSLDLHALSKQLDITKSKVFLSEKNAAFLGSLMCSLNFVWSRDLPTAATNAITFWWNPDWFLSLDPEVRKTVLMHELWHVARLHMVRLDNRNPRYWNYACVAKGTKIAMADGSEQLVETIESGDEIANINSGTSTVGVKINSGAKPIYEIILESGRILRCSGDHKVLTDEGFRNADTLSKGDSCFVDTRYGRVLEEELEPENNTANR